MLLQIGRGNLRISTIICLGLKSYSQVPRHPSKKSKQIAGLESAFIAADDIEFPDGRKIPLWLFGFLY